MIKKFASLILLLQIFKIIFPGTVHAVESPTAVENNKFGIHIINEVDLDDASRLVNSSGGDWGYVTFVIREDERDIGRWQKVFNRARKLHLIPIVRVASSQSGENWTKPATEDIESWVKFFDSLNWVTKNRYIVVGNEPNHATEWGGEVKPLEYAKYFETFSQRLKVSTPDYFLLPAGLDSSAPNDKTHMSAEKFIQTILKSNSKFFNHADGWTSHSYPNPNFSGPPTASGQRSVRGYDWELSILRKYGVTKNLPVFITETGWAHETPESSDFLNPDTLSDYYKKLFDIYNNDSRIICFTPFILSYQNPPFDIFSWKKPDGSFYPFFEETQKILKVKGTPIQIVEAEIVYELIPEFIKRNGKIFAAGIGKNTGQSIWIRDQNIEADSSDGKGKIEIDSPVFTDIEPGKIGIILYRKI